MYFPLTLFLPVGKIVQSVNPFTADIAAPFDGYDII